MSFVVITIPPQNTTERHLIESKELNQNTHLLENLTDMTYPTKTTTKIVAGTGENKSSFF
jgi:hypothetical protein